MRNSNFERLQNVPFNKKKNRIISIIRESTAAIRLGLIWKEIENERIFHSAANWNCYRSIIPILMFELKIVHNHIVCILQTFRKIYTMKIFGWNEKRIGKVERNRAHFPFHKSKLVVSRWYVWYLWEIFLNEHVCINNDRVE